MRLLRLSSIAIRSGEELPIGALTEYLRGKIEGVEFAGETLDTGVCFIAFFADPDGNALMLHHRYAPRNA